MAIISSHILNGLDGTHASGIAATLFQVGSQSSVASSVFDDGGRMAMEIAPRKVDSSVTYELVFATGDYWNEQGQASPGIIEEVVLRFSMQDPEGKYHMPIILSPYSYSTWKSG